MQFCVWLVKTPPHFDPAAWDDNPETAVAVNRILGACEHSEANDTARGFNTRELDRPLGLWAIVCKVGAEPAKGQAVALASAIRPLEN